MDDIQKPKHYTKGSIECIDAIDAMAGDGRLEFYRCSIMQYVWRCFDKGDTVTDLKKARWYINRLIAEVEKETA